MKTRLALIGILGVVAVLLLPGIAVAQSTDCAAAVNLVADGRVLDVFLASGSDFWFRIAVNSGKSYNIQMITKFADVLVGGPTVFAPGDVDTGTCTGASSLAVNVSTFNDPDLGGNSRGRAFVAPANGDVLLRLPGNGNTNQITVTETTLYNPLWSTAGGFETFYRFMNTTSGSCSVTLTMRNDAGALVGGTPITFNVTGNSTVPTRNTGAGDLNVANGLAGNATIAHDCPPGAIQVDGFTGIFGASTAVLPIKIVAAREYH